MSSILTPEPIHQVNVMETPIEAYQVVEPCQDNCKHPFNTCSQRYSSGWIWVSALILWFIVFTVLFWLVYYSLKPPFVIQADSNQVDTAKVLFAAIISALILVLVI